VYLCEYFIVGIMLMCNVYVGTYYCNLGFVLFCCLMLLYDFSSFCSAEAWNSELINVNARKSVLCKMLQNGLDKKSQRSGQKLFFKWTRLYRKLSHHLISPVDTS